MSLTSFGDAVRTIRRESAITLAKMAADLGTSAAFLSAMETGRSKVPMDWVERIAHYFGSKGQEVNLDHLKAKACDANDSVSLEGLPPQHRMLIAGFANSHLNQDQLTKLGQLLEDVYRENNSDE
jgi:transcriptional regulator with XRE-family HTH domain